MPMLQWIHKRSFQVTQITFTGSLTMCIILKSIRSFVIAVYERNIALCTEERRSIGRVIRELDGILWSVCYGSLCSKFKLLSFLRTESVLLRCEKYFVINHQKWWTISLDASSHSLWKNVSKKTACYCIVHHFNIIQNENRK